MEPNGVSRTDWCAPTPADGRRALLQRLQSLLASGVQQLPAVTASQPNRVGDAVPAPHLTVPAPTTPALAALPRSPATESAHEIAGGLASESGPSPAGLTRPSRPAPAAPSLLIPSDPFSFPLDRTQREVALQVLNGEVMECRLCVELARTRKQTVFGTGNPLSRLVFVGEAPGADEDQQGEPFVGRAGQKLNDIIHGCGLRREDVYIMNVLKCRPPGNRTPTSQEASCCRPFFERQLEILSPSFIVCLGSVAATNLLQTNQSIGGLRGRWHNYRGAQVVVTYHPSYLLRVPDARKQVWEDMKMLLAAMGLPIPGKKSQ
ncbi:MAG: uracil-DNA glycosylase family protein [Pirellulales bacterium]